MESWQEKLTTNSSRLSYLWRTGALSDVTVVVGIPPTQKKFKLHKLILSTCSDVFCTMFFGLSQNSNEIEIPDFQPAIFEIAMTHLYEESLAFQNMEEAIHTFCLARRFNIDHLQNLCIIYVNEQLSFRNIHFLYTLPHLLGALQVQSTCEAILRENTSEILNSDHFLNLPLPMLKDMLRLDGLRIQSEKQLFDSVLKWAISACRKRNIAYSNADLRSEMDNFLPDIRFLAMDVEEFLSSPAKSGVLTDSEVATILGDIVTPNTHSLPYWCNKSRSRNTINSFKLIEFHTCRPIDVSSDYVECEILLITGKMNFKGLTIYASLESATDASILSFSVKNYEEIILVDIESSYDPNTCLLKCMLIEPIQLKSLSLYTFSIKSNYSIFPKCFIPLPLSFTETNPRFKVTFTLKLPQINTQRYSHIYEIFYTS